MASERENGMYKNNYELGVDETTKAARKHFSFIIRKIKNKEPQKLIKCVPSVVRYVLPSFSYFALEK